MRTLWLTWMLLALAVSSFGQGRVFFSNSSSTRLSTNDFQGHSGFTTGVNAYRIGLYIAPQGTTDPNAFTLMGPTATNQSGGPAGAADGRFNGNSCCAGFVISNNTGQTIAFQVRAWSYFAGNTYEEALLYSGPGVVYRGSSTIAETTPGTGLALEPNLFGSNPGQVGGFTLTPIIPEPSAWALAMLGAGLLWCTTRAGRRRKISPARIPE